MTDLQQPGVTADSVLPRPADPDGASSGVRHLGYRAWDGARSPGSLRWLVITVVGVRRAWQSMWLRRALFFAWLPSLWFGLGFFLWEQASLYPEWRPALRPFVRRMQTTPELAAIGQAIGSGDFEANRHLVWSWLLQSFFRYSQAVLMVMVVGLIAPPLISQDIRSRAFLLYFSRPLTRGEYLMGKLATLWVYLLMIATVPALGMYVIGLMLSPNLSVVGETWDIPLRILGASVALMLPTSVLALCTSSLTQESRYAAFGWFTIWVLGWFTFAAATASENLPRSRFAPEAVQDSAWTHLSLYHTLGRVQRWVFGFAEFDDVVYSILILLAITVVSLAILVHRISAPMRV